MERQSANNKKHARAESTSHSAVHWRGGACRSSRFEPCWESVQHPLAEMLLALARTRVIYCGAVRNYRALHNLRRSYFTCPLHLEKDSRGRDNIPPGSICCLTSNEHKSYKCLLTFEQDRVFLSVPIDCGCWIQIFIKTHFWHKHK